MTIYTPNWPDHSEWLPLATAVLSVATTTAAETSYSEEQLATSVARYLRWRARAGLSTGSAAFERLSIEEFIAHGLEHYSSDAGRNTIRSRLLRVAETVNPGHDRVALVPLGGSAPSLPYSNAELARLRRWANSQPTEARVSDASVLLALGVGAGLRGREIVATTGTDLDDVGVRVPGDGVTVRYVTVLDEWLPEFASAGGRDGWVFRPGRSTANHNAITDFVARSAHRPTGLAITTRRMRATFLKRHRALRTPNLVEIAGVENEAAILRFERISLD